jgi:hypothetical protein
MNVVAQTAANVQPRPDRTPPPSADTYVLPIREICPPTLVTNNTELKSGPGNCGRLGNRVRSPANPLAERRRHDMASDDRVAATAASELDGLRL